MENYKQLNSELIAQVQEMRVDIGIYRKELVNLRGQLADEHQQRVEQQHRFIAILSRCFRESLNEIDPTLDIYQALGGDERSLPYSNRDITASQGGSEERRSAAGIVQELRRSMAMERRTAVTISPIYSRSSGRLSSGSRSIERYSRGSLAEEIEMEESDIESEVDPNELDSEETGTNKTLIYAATDMDIIVEDDEEETENMAACEPQIPKRNQTKRLHKDLALNSPLKDLTNLSTSTETESPNSPHIVMRRGGRRKCDEIEAPRCIKSGFYQKDESVSLPRTTMTNASRKENTTCGSTSYLISDLSMRHLEDAPSSTPCNLKSQNSENRTCRRSLRSAVLGSSDSSPTMPSTILSNEANSSRPGRKCKPKNLKEPHLGTKLRNEEVKKKTHKIRGAKR